jgi:hypothetical protein
MIDVQSLGQVEFVRRAQLGTSLLDLAFGHARTREDAESVMSKLANEGWRPWCSDTAMASSGDAIRELNVDARTRSMEFCFCMFRDS